MRYLLPCSPKGFHLAKTKCSYLANYGISYFLELLLNTPLMELEHFLALSFESHDKVEKQGQTYIHIGFWNNFEDIVATRYYSSRFLGKTGGADIFSKLEKCLGPL